MALISSVVFFLNFLNLSLLYLCCRYPFLQQFYCPLLILFAVGHSHILSSCFATRMGYLAHPPWKKLLVSHRQNIEFPGHLECLTLPLPNEMILSAKNGQNLEGHQRLKRRKHGNKGRNQCIEGVYAEQ